MSIEHRQLKRWFSEVFERCYPVDVADALAVLHAQLHVEFARGLAAVPVAEGNVRHTLQVHQPPVQITGQERSRVASVLRKARGEEIPCGVSSTGPEMVRSELRDLMISMGKPITIIEGENHLRSFGVGRSRVRDAMRFLIRQGKVLHVGGKTKFARYEWVNDTPEA